MDDWTGNFEMVNPALIVIDHRYQRDERPGLVATISANPSWAPFSVITCIKRANGVLAAVDGQQRLAGLMASAKPPKLVPVVWFAVATLEEEARIFTVMNEARKALFPLEKHQARIVSKEIAALAINRAVDKACFTVGQNYDSPRTIKAIGALNAVYNDLGEEGLVQVLVVIREAWPDDRGATGPLMLKLVAQIIGESNGAFNRQKLTAALAKTSPARVTRKADEITLDIGGSKQANVRRALKALVKV